MHAPQHMRTGSFALVLTLVAAILGPLQIAQAPAAAAVVACDATAITTTGDTPNFSSSGGVCTLRMTPGSGSVTLPSYVSASTVDLVVAAGDGETVAGSGYGGRGALLYVTNPGVAANSQFFWVVGGAGGSSSNVGAGRGGSGVYQAGGDGGGYSSFTYFTNGGATTRQIVAGGGGGGAYGTNGGNGGATGVVTGEQAGSNGGSGSVINGGGGNAGIGPKGVTTSLTDVHDADGYDGTSGVTPTGGDGGAYSCCGGSGFGSGGGGGGGGKTGGGGGASGPNGAGAGGGGSSYKLNISSTVTSTISGTKGSDGYLEISWTMRDASASPTTLNATNDVTFASPIAVTLSGGTPSGVNVTAACSGSCTGVTLSGTVTRASGSDGVATFNDLKLVGPSGARTITFTPASGGYPTTSVAVTLAVGAASAAQTQITVSPTTVTVDSGSNTSTVTVQLKDSGGNNLTTNGVSALALSLPAGSNGTLSAPSYTNSGQYTATYTAPTATAGVNALISGTMTPSGGSSASITDTATVTVNPGTPTHLNITTSPSTNANRTNFSPAPVLQLLDQYNNVVTTSSGTGATATISSGPVGATLTGASATFSSGVATFSSLQTHGLTGSYVISLAAGAPFAGLIAQTFTVEITPGPAAALAITTQPVAAAAAGSVMTTQPVVEIRDADGNRVTGSSAVVTLTPQAGGFVGPDATNYATQAAVSGVATFEGVSFGGPLNSGRTMTFSSPSLTSVTSNAVTSTAAGPAYKLTLTQSASTPIASGGVFGTQPVVTRQDYGGNTVSTAPQATVTATVTPTGTHVALVGTTTVTTIGGVGTFAGLGLSGASGTTYTLTFASPGLVSATQTVVAAVGAPVAMSLTAATAAEPAGATYNTAFTTQPKVQIVDTGNNAVTSGTSGVIVTVSIASGAATFMNGVTTTATTDANGLATFSGLALAPAQVGQVGPVVLKFSATNYPDILSEAFTLNKAVQTIVFSGLAGKTYGNAPFAISATDSVDYLITYSSDSPTVCDVSGNAMVSGTTPKATGAVVTLLGAGTCSITAAQAGDSYYAASSQTQTFSVAKAAQATLTIIAPTTVSAGQSVHLATRGGSGTGSVAYTPTGVCSVSGSTLTFTGAGDCSVTAVKAADDNYNASSPSAALAYTAASGHAVTKTPQTVAFTTTVPAKPLVAEVYTPAATSTSGMTVTLAVSAGSSAVCSIASGEVTFDAAGTCVVTADQPGDNRYSAATQVVQTIVVYASNSTAAAGQANQSISFTQPDDVSVTAPDFALAATASSGLAIGFSTTSAASVCTVTPAGLVHVVGVGSCVVLAAQAGDAGTFAADTVTRAFAISAGTPLAPFITSVSAANGTATVAFLAPGFDGGSSITGYRLVATPLVGASVITTSCSTTSPCVLTGLVNDTLYSLSLAAINGVGVGEQAVVDDVTSTNSPFAPANPQASRSAGSTSATVTWTAVTNAQLAGATFTRYDIYVRPVGGAWPGTAAISDATQSSTSAIVTGLDPSLNYEFKVVVITSLNPTPTDANSVVIGSTQVTVPGAPLNLDLVSAAGSSQLIVWNEPASDGGSPVTSYVVSISSGAVCGTITITANHAASCVVSGMSAGVRNVISVSAVNAIGSGAAATTTYGTDPQGGGGGGPSGDPAIDPTVPTDPTLPPVDDTAKGSGGGNDTKGNGSTKGVKPPAEPGKPVLENVPGGPNPAGGPNLSPGTRVTVSLPVQEPGADGKPAAGQVLSVVFAVVDANGKVIRRVTVNVSPGDTSATAIIRPRITAGQRVVAYTTNEAGVSANAPYGSNLLHKQTTKRSSTGAHQPFGRQVIGPIVFAGGSASLSKADEQALDRAATWIKKHSGRIYVTGYARTGGGSQKYLERLSTSRAYAVASYLAKRGVLAWTRYWGMGPRTRSTGNARDRQAVITWSDAPIPESMLRSGAVNAYSSKLVTLSGKADG